MQHPCWEWLGEGCSPGATGGLLPDTGCDYRVHLTHRLYYIRLRHLLVYLIFYDKESYLWHIMCLAFFFCQGKENMQYGGLVLNPSDMTLGQHKAVCSKPHCTNGIHCPNLQETVCKPGLQQCTLKSSYDSTNKHKTTNSRRFKFFV